MSNLKREDTGTYDNTTEASDNTTERRDNTTVVSDNTTELNTLGTHRMSKKNALSTIDVM